jgi:phosphomethylpyrimidine synthase
MKNKVYISGDINKIKVGMTRVNLTDTRLTGPDGATIVKNNSPITMYDTAGPYSDAQIETSIRDGIKRIREEWYGRRKDLSSLNDSPPPPPSSPPPSSPPDAAAKEGVTPFPVAQPVFQAKSGRQITQLYYAKKRIITPEMEYVAIRENQQVEALGLKSYITPDFVRREIAAGRAVIPSNINHPEVEPMIIGQRFLVKVNTNISPSGDPVERDVEEIIAYCQWGTDTLMDLSLRENSPRIREWLIRNSPVPVGACTLYQALIKTGGDVEALNWEIFRDALIEQGQQGVDFVAIHAAIRRKHLRLVSNRLTDLVSYSGVVLCEWMKIHRKENFLHTHFNEICEIIKAYDMTLAIGNGLRPGSIYDANDRAQLAELAEMRPLVEQAWDQFVQVMVESSGHIPLNKIEPNVREYLYICKGAPFFTFGNSTTDIAGRHDHVASAIGAAQIAWRGASLISGNVLKPTEGQQVEQDVRDSIIAHKIAAHAADLAKGHPGAQVRDNAFGKARRDERWGDLLYLAIDPKIN